MGIKSVSTVFCFQSASLLTFLCVFIGPDDEVLKEALHRYAREGLKLEERVVSLHDELGYSIRYVY